jgi:hypothetical protein
MFLLDTNLGLHPDEKPWTEIFPRAGIVTSSTTDLPELDAKVERHEPDVVLMPIADFHGLLARGDDYYRGFALLTSKFTGSTSLPSVMVVRSGDAATCLDDLAGTTYGYINRSCTSSFYSPAILLAQRGKVLEQFFTIEQTKPWQGQIDAVTSGWCDRPWCPKTSGNRLLPTPTTRRSSAATTTRPAPWSSCETGSTNPFRRFSSTRSWRGSPNPTPNSGVSRPTNMTMCGACFTTWTNCRPRSDRRLAFCPAATCSISAD